MAPVPNQPACPPPAEAETIQSPRAQSNAGVPAPGVTVPPRSVCCACSAQRGEVRPARGAASEERRR